MTRPYSPSRGIMYTAPPAEDEKPEERTETPEIEEPEHIEASANWTGTVPADD